jgi:hypothetical protein
LGRSPLCYRNKQIKRSKKYKTIKFNKVGYILFNKLWNVDSWYDTNKVIK